MTRLCPVCLSSKTVFVSAGYSSVYTYLNGLCRTCNSIWKERHGPDEVEQSDIELFAPTRAAVMAQWQERLKAEASQTPLQDKVTSQGHTDADGCPLCSSKRIKLQVYGPGAAACTCLECGCTWDHLYDTAEERVTRTNVKARGEITA